MNERPKIEKLQDLKCQEHGVQPVACDSELKIGVSLNVREGLYPLNGLRCNPSGDTCGWYIWAGEWSDDPGFFKPLHVVHLPEWCPEVLPFLRLPPGWRFLIAPEHEDVWYDEKLEL